MERKATATLPNRERRQPTSSYNDQTPTSNASPLTTQIVQSQWPNVAVDESVKVAPFTPFPPLNNSSSAHNLAIHHEHLHPSSSLLSSPLQSQSIGSMLSTDSFSPSVAESTLSESSHPLHAAIASDDPQTRSILKAVTVLLKSGKVSSCHACKTTKVLKNLLYCTRQIDATHKRKCRKKYCSSCLLRSYDIRITSLTAFDVAEFVCPSCRGICICAACSNETKERITSQQQPSTPKSNNTNAAPSTLSTASCKLPTSSPSPSSSSSSSSSSMSSSLRVSKSKPSLKRDGRGDRKVPSSSLTSLSPSATSNHSSSTVTRTPTSSNGVLKSSVTTISPSSSAQHPSQPHLTLTQPTPPSPPSITYSHQPNESSTNIPYHHPPVQLSNYSPSYPVPSVFPSSDRFASPLMMYQHSPTMNIPHYSIQPSHHQPPYHPISHPPNYPLWPQQNYSLHPHSYPPPPPTHSLHPPPPSSIQFNFYSPPTHSIAPFSPPPPNMIPPTIVNPLYLSSNLPLAIPPTSYLPNSKPPFYDQPHSIPPMPPPYNIQPMSLLPPSNSMMNSFPLVAPSFSNSASASISSVPSSIPSALIGPQPHLQPQPQPQPQSQPFSHPPPMVVLTPNFADRSSNSSVTDDDDDVLQHVTNGDERRGPAISI